MFELNVGSTPCEVTPKEYKQLAQKTEGCVIIIRIQALLDDI